MVSLKKVVIILLIVSFILSLFTGYMIFFYDKIEVNLKGKDIINLEYEEEYNDEGIVVKNRGKVIPSNNYNVASKSDLKNNYLGKYTINYDVHYKGKDYKLERTINVVDTVAPIIEANKDEVKKDYCSKKISTNLTYTATDNYDGDLTSRIETKEENDTLILSVEDSSNNKATKGIKINYGEKPGNKFTLVGNTLVNVQLNGTYKESGIKYTDGCGNKIDKEVKTTGEVNTSEVGQYKITYEIDGEKTLTRTVNVYDPTVSKPIGSKIIYLTFDDGPGYYTNKILATLDKYNVKATFFVTAQFPSYLNLIKVEHDKGHAIAVHSYTHNYNIYTSYETYIADFNKMNEVIKNYTGSYTRLFRFPGGSSNTVSKSYNKGIMTELAQRMTEDGYVYFDWNVSSGDASASPTTSKIISNTINGVKNCSSCVVLMHDFKSVTANALDTIVSSFVESGYTFATLNESSGTFHHHINN